MTVDEALTTVDLGPDADERQALFVLAVEVRRMRERDKELTALRKLASERLDRVKELEAECEGTGGLNAAFWEREAMVSLEGIKDRDTEIAKLKAELAAVRDLRKLASERLDRVTELAAENGELKHQLNGVVQENEALRAELATVQSALKGVGMQEFRRLEAQLATAREDTRRAERDWTKALAERDEARTQRDARQVLNEDLRAELEARKASTSGYTHDLLNREILDHKTTRAALREAHRVMSDHESMDLDAEMDAAVAMIERALNEVSK